MPTLIVTTVDQFVNWIDFLFFILLGEELTGNLRRLKPEGNLLEDRFKSMQKRNVFETRIKKKVPKAKRRKKVEKRAYKMGFSWEKK